MARPMRTPTSRCVITCALDGDGAMQLATRPAAKANRIRMNEPPLVGGASRPHHPRFALSDLPDYPMRGRFEHSETAPNAFNRRNFRARAAPLNLRCLFAIRAPDLSRGRWAAPGRSDPQSQTRQRRSLEMRGRSGIY